MTFIALKEKLHEYIEHADEKKVTAIYTLVENEIEDTNFVYDEDTLDMLESRVQEFHDSGHPGYTVEESMEFVKNELKKRGL